MPLAAAIAISVVVGYALGSIPWAQLIARARGVDLTAVGTGNPGAANAFREMGKGWGIAVFVGDAGKASGAVLIANALGADGALALPAGGAATVGHWYPMLGRLPGGMGLAPAIGGAVAAAGPIGALAFVIGTSVVFLLRSTGTGSGFGFTLLIILILVVLRDPGLAAGVFTLALSVFVRRYWRSILRRWVSQARDG